MRYSLLQKGRLNGCMQLANLQADTIVFTPIPPPNDMSGAQGSGSSGQSQPPWLGPNPGRTSYANVAAGVAGSTQQTASVHLPPATGQGAYSSIYADQPSRIPLPVPADLDAQGEGGTRIPESWASGSGRDDLFNTPHYLQQAFNPWGMWLGSPAMSFFRPTYLRGSKYLEDLEASYNASIAAQQEEPPRPRSGHGSLSKSSSAVSLPKIQASHRGMTYEIIEHQPPVVVEETGPRPLPSRWQDSDKHGSLAIGEDGHQVRYVSPTKSPDHEAAAARTDHPMPPQAGIYYYEVYIESKGKDGVIGIGFSTSKVLLERLPGWEMESWAYHGDDGKSFCCSPTGKSYGPTFASGDVVGCGVNFTDRTAFFTKNGVLLGLSTNLQDRIVFDQPSRYRFPGHQRDGVIPFGWHEETACTFGSEFWSETLLF